MKKLVQRTMTQYAMLPDGGRVLCGLSGGADSVSLLLCLKELGIEVCACHLNHGLRGALADADEAFCKQLCKAQDIPFVSERCDAAAQAEQHKQSVETAARQLRYAFFARCAQHFDAVRIATAHTADDNLETMLFHLIRGTGSTGLAGIPPVRDTIIRPLIACERVQIERFLRERGQSWCTDHTNLDDSCTRNRIRHHVLPALRDIEPAAARHAGQTAQLLRQDDACLNALARDGKALTIDCLNQQPPAIAARAVRIALEQAGVPMGEVGQTHITAVCALAHKKKGSVSLPARYRAVRGADRILLEQMQERSAEYPLKPEIPLQFGTYTVVLTKKISDIHNSFKYYPICYDTIIKYNLCVRTWHATDRMTLPHTRGARSLKRLYAERGISAVERDGLPVLCSGDDIITAVGIGTDCAFCGNDGVFVVMHSTQMEQKEREER